jgi:signal transduction histidine kinase
MNNSSKKSKAQMLRKQAEDELMMRKANSSFSHSEIEMLKMVHELEVHQIELEMVNKELELSKEKVEIIVSQYTELYDFAPISYFSLSKEGRIIKLNLAGSILLGKERSQLVNSFFGFFVTQDTRLVFHLFLQKVFQSNVKETCDVSISLHNDHIIDVYITGILTENSEQCQLVVVDITDRKQLEQKLRIARVHAEQSDHLKSAFLANMSHEIRTPMNGILGFAELLKQPDLSGEQQQKFINIIEKSGKRMLNIINDIVSISKIESGNMEISISESNINEQIEYIYTFFKPEVEKKGMQLFFKNGLPAKQAAIKTDREKIYAILTNLVKNAIKYSDIGTIEIGYQLKNHDLEFFVKDTGIGISPDKQKIIFDRFIQADITDKRAHQGAGLGLSISKAYIEMLGGNIWVESNEGNGSMFYFTIPYNTEPQKELVVQQAVSVEIYNSVFENLNVLIVDDDEISKILLNQIFDKGSNKIIHASNGLEAIATYQHNPDIDLILMDIRMPEMDGYEATKTIRQYDKDIIIIAQTAFGLSDDKEKAIAAGCNDYISKPINRTLLQQMILQFF